MSVTHWRARTLAGLLVTALCAASPAVPSAPAEAAASTFGPQLPDNPYDGPVGTAAMRGDSGGSGTTPLPGPGTRQVSVRSISLAASCPTILVGSDGLPVTLCTAPGGRNPRVFLLDPGAGVPLASMPVSLPGGASPYLDNAGRLVLVDGANNLVRIAHTRNKLGLWSFSVAESISLATALSSGDAVTSVAPGYDGKVWYATDGGSIGVVDTVKRSVTTLALPDGEHVANGISTAPQGTAVISTHALYLLTEDASGRPVVKFRVGYDRGSAL